MFCDWDRDSVGLVQQLWQQTSGYDIQHSLTFSPSEGWMEFPLGLSDRGVTFVGDDSYTHAVLFNQPTVDLSCPKENVICLLLEPPEIMSYQNLEGIRRFSFCDGHGVETAYGLGFATVPVHSNFKMWAKARFEDRSHRNGMCMMVSDKLLTPYHFRRHEIRDAILATDLPIDFYGRNMASSDDPRVKGEIPFGQKGEVFRNYQRVIDFENSPHGAVTDKFFDPILTYTVPVSNAGILHELAPGAFDFVDFSAPMPDILRMLEHLVEAPVDEYAEPVEKARNELLMGKLNLARWIVEKLSE